MMSRINSLDLLHPSTNNINNNVAAQSTEDVFGKDFILAKRENWKDYYLDYEALMEVLIAMQEREILRRQERRRHHQRHDTTPKMVRSVPHLLDLLHHDHDNNNSATITPDDENTNDTVARGGTANVSGDGPSPLSTQTSRSAGELGMMTSSIHSCTTSATKSMEQHQEQQLGQTSPPLPVVQQRPRGLSLPLEEGKGNDGNDGNFTGVPLRLYHTDAFSRMSISSQEPIPPLPAMGDTNDQSRFCTILDQELDKIGLFYLQEQGLIAKKISALLHEIVNLKPVMTNIMVQLQQQPTEIDNDKNNHDKKRDDDDNNNEWEVGLSVQNVLNKCRLVANDLVELFHFVAINITAIRKVIDRHDALVRRFGDTSSEQHQQHFQNHHHRHRSEEQQPPLLLSEWYITTRNQDDSSHLKTVFHHHGLMALEGSLRKGMMMLQSHETHIVGEEVSKFIPFVGDMDMISNKMKDAERSSWKDFIVNGGGGVNTISFEPTVMHDHFRIGGDKKEDNDMRYFVEWRQRYGIFSSTVSEGDGDSIMDLTYIGNIEEENKAGIEDGIKYKWPLGLTLNLFSTFLYMTNYFIAGPTSVRYIDALGGHEAFASLLIGATPWAVTISTFLFSVWTNYSFKKPLFCSVFLLCLGNLLYASALRYESIEMVMAGRLVTGLGSPRVINRRFIADTSPLHQRTAVSAAFVTFSAAGTAVGPGLAVLLQTFDTSFEIPLFGTIILNGLTAPGWFMFVVWSLFFVTLVFTLDEPVRIGLLQQPACSDSTVGSRSDHGQGDEETPLLGEGTTDTMNDGTVGNGISLVNQRAKDDIQIAQPENYGSVSEAHHLENEPLVEPVKFDESSKGAEDTTYATSTCFFFGGLTWPVLICMMLLFINKLSIESLISSAPLITETRYDWTVDMIGALGFVIGMLVIPLSIFIGWLSRHHEDGKLLLGLLCFTAAGLLLLLDTVELFGKRNGEEVTQSYGLLGVGPHRYIYGCIFSFSGLQAMESIIMSTLSKVVPYSLAVGTCNSGLLNTEIGTIGRAIGDSLLTLLGLFDLKNLLNLLIIPLLLLMGGCIIIVKLNYRIFTV